MLGVCSGPSQVAAQQPTPALVAKPKAYIRVWNMLPVTPTNNLFVSAGDKPMFGVAPSDLYTDYFASPVGGYILTVKRSGDKDDPAKKVPVVLQDGTYITLLATQKGAEVNIEMLNDTPNPNVKEVTGSLVVRSFLTGGRVMVGITGGRPPQPIPDNATVNMDDLPMTAGVNITVLATMPTTPPTTNSFDLPVDFSVTHHATLMLVSDRYGRLKPKLIYNGRVANPDAQRQREKDGR